MEFKVFSMTGFSSLNLNFGENLNLILSIRSLNSKYFEFNSKLPFALSSLENLLSKKFKSKLLRGNINFSIYIENQNNLNLSIEPDFNVLDQYIKSIEKIKNRYNIKENINVHDILRLQNIFLIKEDLNDDINDNLIKSIDRLIEDLLKERVKEGNILAKDILDRINLIKNYMEKLEPRSLLVIENKKELVNQTLNKLANNINNLFNLENSSNIAEYISLTIYNQIEKLDIHEEIVRFKSHIESLINLIKSDLIEKGKKIDFILQELFREINTIGAKCSDTEVNNLAINIKVEIEKAREQVQNIV